MLSFLPLCAVVGAAVFAWFLYRFQRSRGRDMPWIFYIVTVILPFAAGGFHSYVAAITSLFLAANLIYMVRKTGKLMFVYNLNSAALICVAVGYCLTPMWAADRGMAVFGIVRMVPVLLYSLTLMQLSLEQKENCLRIIPLTGALMTVFSSLLLLLPNTDAYLTVQGRLSGFLQYPNSFAAFLLAGIILQYTKKKHEKWDLLLNGILILGVILSGSKTGFVLLIVSFFGILWFRRSKKVMLMLLIPIGLGLLLALAVSQLNVLRHADRFTDIHISSGSFLVRLLYYKDVIPQILKNPFGYGYMGYRALEGSFQTSRYYVTYIHNGLLQLLFEIGWFPALLLAAAFLRALFSKKTPPSYRLVLTIILAHCMLDFDLQYLVFWIILLSCLDFESGKRYCVRKGVGIATCVISTLICAWLGMGDLLCHLGKTEACLKMTPFHTDALSAAMQKAEDMQELDILADKILNLNPTSSLAYSAKANAALSKGEVLEMITYKERAILCARYTTEEYLDYFDKLYAVMEMYLRSGDTESALYCKKKLFGIADAMRRVSEMTDPLAFTTGDDASLVLPNNYLEILTQLSTSNESPD